MQANPTEKLTRYREFSHKKLGTFSEPNLKGKGGEAWGFLLFIQWKLSSLRGTRFMTERIAEYLEAAGALINIVVV